MRDEDKPKRIAQQLIDADWYHEYSDDIKVSNRGALERKRLVDHLGRLDEVEAGELIKLFVPAGQQKDFLREVLSAIQSRLS